MPFRALLLWVSLATVSLGESWTIAGRTSNPAPPGLQFSKIEVESAGRVAHLHVVTFSSSTHTFALMDDPANAYDLASAAKKRGAVAAVNGGYFKPDRTPLGLRVRQGREIHPLQRARLLSGLLVVNGHQPAVLRVAEFKRSPKLREAVQTGPFLVDGGKTVAGLNAIRPASRTVIVSRGSERFGILTTSPITLAAAGQILSTPGLIPGFSVSRALNLDGGSSTGLWVAGDPPFYSRELRNVRDFVGVVPR